MTARGSGQPRDRLRPADPARRQHPSGRRGDPGDRFSSSLRREFPALFLIIAPRHVERTRRDRGSTARPRPAIGAAERSQERRSTDCLLLDTTGELRDWYAVATIVFIGKSLTARGGQNPVEAIVADHPVIFGPHMENFASLARALVANRAAIQVPDPESLQEKIGWLLRDREAALHMVANAQTVLARHSGATRRTAKLVMALGNRD